MHLQRFWGPIQDVGAWDGRHGASVDREQCTITNAEFMITQLACRALAKRSIFAMFEFKMIGTIRPIAPGRSPGRASVSRALGRRFRVNRTEARVMMLFCNRQYLLYLKKNIFVTYPSCIPYTRCKMCAVGTRS